MLLYTAKQAGRNAVAFRDTDTGFVRLSGAAAARRSIPQLAHERTVRRPAVGCGRHAPGARRSEAARCTAR